MKKEIEDARRRRIENEERERKREEEERARREKRAGSSETDYGVEETRPGSSKSRSSPKDPSTKRSLPSSPTARSTTPTKKSLPPPTLITRAGNIITNLTKLVGEMAGGFKTRPMFLLQMLTFLIGFLVVISRRDVKERLKRLLREGWGKVRRTAGMGVKVSYI